MLYKLDCRKSEMSKVSLEKKERGIPRPLEG